VGLEHKKYMIYNKQSTKEEYESIVKAFLNDEEQRAKYLVEFHNLA
jgi:rubrerythrin